MKREGTLGDWQARSLRRIALAACAPADRPWVEALFRELNFIEGAWPRASWLLGTARLVAEVTKQRFGAMLSLRLRVATVVAFCAALLSVLISRAGYEGLGVDDDVFLILALVCVAAPAARLAIARRDHGAAGPSSPGPP